MKTPVVDYREFRLKKLNEPRFSHPKLLVGWLVYFLFYFLTENLIPASACHPVHCWVDDVVPFTEWFVIFYVGWFFLIAFSLIYFALYDIESFKSLSKFIMITQFVAIVCYIVYPTRQDLRPEVFPRNNIVTAVLTFIYAFDTPTGVCPSLHVAYSLGIASVWLKRKDSTVLTKVFITAFATCICLSVMFVKQHSAVDVFFAIILGALAELVVFRKRYFQKAHFGKSEPFSAQ